MTVRSQLDHYAAPGPMTDLSSCDPSLLAGLPSEPDDLFRVVRGCITAGPLPEGRNDTQLRTARSMVERISELDPSPLVDRRPPERRFIGVCRHFATLGCAFLRHKGTPARVRAGFGAYFEANTWNDHWVVEYWNGDRWILVDVQWGPRWFASHFPDESAESVTRRLFLTGGEAWARCRNGDLDADRFNMGGENWGIGEIRGSVLFDLAAVNNDEMLPWDTWGRMEDAFGGRTDDAYDTMLDQVADVVASDDVEAIRALYLGNDDLRVPPATAGRGA